MARNRKKRNAPPKRSIKYLKRFFIKAVICLVLLGVFVGVKAIYPPFEAKTKKLLTESIDLDYAKQTAFYLTEKYLEEIEKYGR